MPLDRRALVAGLSTSLVAPHMGLAQPARVRNVTDAAGRAVPVPARVERIFPAGPPAAIALYTVAPDLLLGWARATTATEREFLLLDIGTVNPTFVSLADRVQQQTGVPYALLDGRFDGIAGSYRLIGELVGRRDAAEERARYVENTVKTITSRIADIAPGERPRVYYARGPRGLETGLGGSINVETIELLARNVAGETRGGLGTVSIEQVLRWNPDVIITIDREFAANSSADRTWGPVAAVQSKRVHLSPQLPFGWVDFPPSVNRLIGMWWLAKIFYPERFPEDMRTLTREFYGVFYHVSIDDRQIERILAGA